MVLDTEGTDNFDTCDDDRTILFDQVERYRGAYSFSDLFAYDLVTQRMRRLTSGARIREPACAPDGSWAAAVQVIRGRTRLVKVELESGRVEVLLDPGALDQVAFPTVSPDGRYIAATRVSERDGRTIVVLDLSDGSTRTLGADAANELHPRFTADGAWLLYTSDRTGVFDVYAQAWPDGPTRRVTRVVGGALDPVLSPDGATLVFRALGSGGYDLARRPFETAALMPEPPPPPDPRRSVAPGVAQPVGDRPLPSRPYAPSETLWPVAWSPLFSFTTPTESTSRIGVTVEGGDAAGHHSLFGEFATLPEVETMSAQVAYGYRRLTPGIGLGLTRTTRTLADSAFFSGARHDYRERVTQASASLSFPFSRVDQSASASMRYTLTDYRAAENPDPRYDPLDPSPRFPVEGQAGQLAFGMSYQSTDTYELSVSQDRGRSVGLTFQVRDPRFGGDFQTQEVFFNWHEYLSLWWRHALALRVAGAYGQGETRGRIFYSLGPAPEREILLDALDRIYFGNGYLRGYPAGTERGDRYVLAKLEYRMPVWDIFGGPSMVPLFLRRLKLALFTDWGQARTEPLEVAPSAFSKSVGFEFVTQAVLGWRLPVELRTGYAEGLDDAGETQIYFYLGSWY